MSNYDPDEFLSLHFQAVQVIITRTDNYVVTIADRRGEETFAEHMRLAERLSGSSVEHTQATVRAADDQSLRDDERRGVDHRRKGTSPAQRAAHIDGVEVVIVAADEEHVVEHARRREDRPVRGECPQLKENIADRIIVTVSRARLQPTIFLRECLSPAR